jgi:hypothetical protein
VLLIALPCCISDACYSSLLHVTSRMPPPHHPHSKWQLDCRDSGGGEGIPLECRGKGQHAYRITITEASAGDDTSAGGPVVWDSAVLTAPSPSHTTTVNSCATTFLTDTAYTATLFVWERQGAQNKTGQGDGENSTAFAPLAPPPPHQVLSTMFRTALHTNGMAGSKEWMGAAWIGGGTQLRG